jgi:hypothetical protein
MVVWPEVSLPLVGLVLPEEALMIVNFKDLVLAAL